MQETGRRLEAAIISIQGGTPPKEIPGLRQDIHDASISGDKELRGLAAAVAYMVVEPHFTAVAKKHQDTYGRPEVDDFLGDLKLYILQHIEEYDPQYSLNTWMEHRYMPIFQETKDNEYGINKTIHEKRVERMVIRAKAEILKSTGNASPSDVEVYDYISSSGITREKGKVSFSAVRRAMQGTTVYAATDSLSAVPDASQNPEKNIIEKEASEKLLKTLKKLSRRSREIVLAEMRFLESFGEMPSVEELLPELQDMYPGVTEEELQRYIFSAHRELRGKYRSGEENRIAPRAQAESIETDTAELEAQMEKEEEMLMSMISMDPSFLDFL